MFQSAFQGGTHVELLSTQGKNPLEKWKTGGKVSKVFEKEIKGYIYNSESVGSKLQIPKDEKLNLALVQSFLVLQVYFPVGQNVHIELGVTDLSSNKRRIIFHSGAKEITVNPLHARIPVTVIRRGIWLNLAIDVVGFTSRCFKGYSFRSLDLIQIASVCKLRKVFTMKNPLCDDSIREALEEVPFYEELINPSAALFDEVPRTVDFPAGIPHGNQFVTYYRVVCASSGASTAPDSDTSSETKRKGPDMAFGHRAVANKPGSSNDAKRTKKPASYLKKPVPTKQKEEVSLHQAQFDFNPEPSEDTSMMSEKSRKSTSSNAAHQKKSQEEQRRKPQIVDKKNQLSPGSKHSGGNTELFSIEHEIIDEEEDKEDSYDEEEDQQPRRRYLQEQRNPDNNRQQQHQIQNQSKQSIKQMQQQDDEGDDDFYQEDEDDEEEGNNSRKGKEENPWGANLQNAKTKTDKTKIAEQLSKEEQENQRNIESKFAKFKKRKREIEMLENKYRKNYDGVPQAHDKGEKSEAKKEMKNPSPDKQGGNMGSMMIGEDSIAESLGMNDAKMMEELEEFRRGTQQRLKENDQRDMRRSIEKNLHSQVIEEDHNEEEIQQEEYDDIDEAYQEEEIDTRANQQQQEEEEGWRQFSIQQKKVESKPIKPTAPSHIVKAKPNPTKPSQQTTNALASKVENVFENSLGDFDGWESPQKDEIQARGEEDDEDNDENSIQDFNQDNGEAKLNRTEEEIHQSDEEDNEYIESMIQRGDTTEKKGQFQQDYEDEDDDEGYFRHNVPEQRKRQEVNVADSPMKQAAKKLTGAPIEEQIRPDIDDIDDEVDEGEEGVESDDDLTKDGIPMTGTIEEDIVTGSLAKNDPTIQSMIGMPKESDLREIPEEGDYKEMTGEDYEMPDDQFTRVGFMKANEEIYHDLNDSNDDQEDLVGEEEQNASFDEDAAQEQLEEEDLNNEEATEDTFHETEEQKDHVADALLASPKHSAYRKVRSNKSPAAKLDNDDDFLEDSLEVESKFTKLTSPGDKATSGSSQKEGGEGLYDPKENSFVKPDNQFEDSLENLSVNANKQLNMIQTHLFQ